MAEEQFEQTFGAGDLARMLGLDESFVAESWHRARPDPEPIRYRHLSTAERNALRERVAEQLRAAEPPAAGPQALARWEAGWGEVLARVREKGASPENLVPQYIRHRMMRYLGRYIRAEKADFEYRVYEAIKSAVFAKYLGDARRIIEFGCGTGMNLALLDHLLSGVELIGLDWARPALDLIGEIAAESRNPMSARRFDMVSLEGAEEIEITPQTALLTLHSMEQLGSGFGPLLDYFKASGAGLCLHIEPMVEFYDAEDEFDRIAIYYHNKRNYLSGYYKALQELEKGGEIEIEEARRLNFGSTYHEAYTLIVWRPL